MQGHTPFPPAGLRRRSLGTGALALALGGFARPGLALDYPTRPVRFVVSGGATELARIVADEMSGHYGKGVYVEPHEGASYGIATEFMAKQPPDGYNWLLTAVSFTGQMLLQPKVANAGLVPVTMLGAFPFVLVVNNDLPVRSVPELVALAKAQPGKLNFASAGQGAPGHLSIEMLKQMAGIDMAHIPYKAVPQGVTAVMANQVQLMFVPAPAVLSLARAGKVRPIAVSTTTRYKALPEVPTVAEQGYPDYLYASWNGIHAAPKTPLDICDRIAADVAAVIDTPAARSRADTVGVDTVVMNRQEFTAFVQADVERIGKVIRNGNIKARGAE